jgi:hypothetical protein
MVLPLDVVNLDRKVPRCDRATISIGQTLPELRLSY